VGWGSSRGKKLKKTGSHDRWDWRKRHQAREVQKTQRKQKKKKQQGGEVRGKTISRQKRQRLEAFSKKETRTAPGKGVNQEKIMKKGWDKNLGGQGAIGGGTHFAADGFPLRTWPWENRTR